MRGTTRQIVSFKFDLLWSHNSPGIFTNMKNIVMISLLSLALPLQAAELQEEWLELDRVVVESLVKALSAECTHVGCLASMLVGVHESKGESLGFSAQRRAFSQFGGYVTARTIVISYKKRIAALEVEVVVSKRQLIIDKIFTENAQLKRDFWEFFQEKKHEGEDRVVLRYFKLKPQEFGPMEKAVAAKLGKPDKLEPPKELAEDYDFLFYPTRVYDYGWSCYYSGEKPVGREAMDRLVEKKEVALIRNILKGYNPVGRLYAMEALHTMSLKGEYSLTKQDKRLFETVLGLSTPVRYCEGCIVSRVKAKDIRAEILRPPSTANPVLMEQR